MLNEFYFLNYDNLFYKRTYDTKGRLGTHIPPVTATQSDLHYSIVNKPLIQLSGLTSVWEL